MLGLLHVHQPHIRLVHERRRLERLARFLLGHLGRRQFPQLVVDQRQKLLGGRGVALLDGDRICVTSVIEEISPRTFRAWNSFRRASWQEPAESEGSQAEAQPTERDWEMTFFVLVPPHR